MTVQESDAPDGALLSGRTAVGLSATAALAAGLVEVAFRVGVQRGIMHRALDGGFDLVWMTPLSYLLLALLALLLAAALGHLRWFTRAPEIALLVFPAILGLAFTVPKLHHLAAFVLALGVSIQLGRVLARRMDARSPRLLVTAALLALVIVGVGSGWRLLGAWREKKEVAALTRARPGAPNILILVLDTVRRGSLSLYGFEKPTTPNLERWARSGTVFDQVWSTAPWTVPSHAGMFTGRYSHELNADFWVGLDGRYPTLAEVLAEHGYATAGFAGNVPYVSYEFGLDRGFHHFEDYQITPGRAFFNSSVGRWMSNEHHSWIRGLLGNHRAVGMRPAAELNRAFLGWSRSAGRPWFGFINYYDAHDPYLAPAPFDTLFQADHRPWVPTDLEPDMPAAELERVRGAYEGAIAYLDHQVSGLLDSLAARGVLDSTIVVVTSDHGEQFGEHGLLTHGNSLYRVLLEVPLYVRWPPAVPADHRVTVPVTLRDLAATVLDLAGIDAQGTIPGTSLRAAWERDDFTSPSPLLSSYRWHTNNRERYSLVGQGFHYIDHRSRAEELYQLEDAAEARNLADTMVASGPVVTLRARRDSILRVAPPHRYPSTGGPLAAGLH